MSNTQTVYVVSDDVRWTDMVDEAMKEARTRTAHKEWTVESVDEYHRDVAVYNDQGRRTGIETEAKIVLRKA